MFQKKHLKEMDVSQELEMVKYMRLHENRVKISIPVIFRLGLLCHHQCFQPVLVEISENPPGGGPKVDRIP